MNQTKTPYYISLKDEECFGFAAIYSQKTLISRFVGERKIIGTEEDDKKTGTEKIGTVVSSSSQSYSCAILTTTPNELIGPIHDRMPVIIRKKDEQGWLDLGTEHSKFLDIFEPYPADRMDAYPVSTFVNSPKNNSQRCIDPIDENTIFKEQFGLDSDQSSLDDFF